MERVFMRFKQEIRKPFSICMPTVVLIMFLFQTLVQSPLLYATTSLTLETLPQPGKLTPLSEISKPVLLKGMKVDYKDPLHMEFLVNAGNEKFSQEQYKSEIERLTKYFLVTLTTPEENL